ncbi:MAG TPA: GFA family protein [Burkholderiales bacterium]|nr:GFA family protein [Burkholderiales bacterium]
MRIDGACHCGNVAYEADIDPADVGLCHCTDCQALTGSAFTTFVYARKGAFRLLRGEPRRYVKTGESGARRVQAFCPECGSRLYACADVPEPEVYNLRVGTIRQRRAMRPQRQLWCRSRLDWVTDIGALPALDTQA